MALFVAFFVPPWDVATCIAILSLASLKKQDFISIRIPKQQHTCARNYLVSGPGTRRSLALISFVSAAVENFHVVHIAAGSGGLVPVFLNP